MMASVNKECARAPARVDFISLMRFGMPLEGRAANCGVPRPAAFERRRCAFEAVDGHQGSIVLRDRAWIDETCINDTDLSHGYGEARKRGLSKQGYVNPPFARPAPDGTRTAAPSSSPRSSRSAHPRAARA